MKSSTAFNSEALREQLLNVTDNHHQSVTLPPSCYSDEHIFQLEVDTIFHQSWIGIGREDRWKSTGDYIAMDIAGVPVIIVRGNDGQLKGFANSCRHRGSLMLSGEGQCRQIRCPFHCWTYKLDGSLKFSPKMEHAVDFKSEDYGLHEFRVSCNNGFAFICLNDETTGLDDWLGGFAEIHSNWALDQLVSTRVRSFEVDCNWKNYIEVFNEYYHLPYVHPNSIAGCYANPDEPEQVVGHFTTQFGEAAGNPALLSDAQSQAFPDAGQLNDRNKNGVRYSWIYPNMTFAIAPDSLWMYEAYPLSPGRSRIVQTVCFPESTTQLADFESRAKHYYDRYDTAIGEDIPFLENQQIGLSSKFAQQGRFSSLEPSVANFAFWYSRTMLRTL